MLGLNQNRWPDSYIATFYVNPYFPYSKSIWLYISIFRYNNFLIRIACMHIIHWT